VKLAVIPVGTVTVKSMQKAIALINNRCAIFCNDGPTGSRAQPLKHEARQFYSHTILIIRKEENQTDIYSIILKPVNLLPFP
jgi:hypothetical protein